MIPLSATGYIPQIALRPPGGMTRVCSATRLAVSSSPMPPQDEVQPVASPALGAAGKVDCSYLLDPAELKQLIDRVRPYTVLSEHNLRELGQQVCAALAQGVPGDFVECGVFRGGACFLVALILQRLDVSDRRVWLMDSFEGMPPP